jgi:hypothetical protein
MLDSGDDVIDAAASSAVTRARERRAAWQAVRRDADAGERAATLVWRGGGKRSESCTGRKVLAVDRLGR